MTKNSTLPKALIYDIETGLHKAYLFRPGKQVITHGQMTPDSYIPYIICISYMHTDKPDKIYTIDFGNYGVNESMIAAFDEVLNKALKSNYKIIGKNNFRFDDKWINTMRLLEGGAPMPDWIRHTEDLEQQLRKYFYLPSYSLDYMSRLLGLGGKDKMDLSDWTAIQEWKEVCLFAKYMTTDQIKKFCPIYFKKSYKTLKADGLTAFSKMISYNQKDVEDTYKIYDYVATHCEWRQNQTLKKDGLLCKHCGSSNLHKNGKRIVAGSLYQNFYCSNHYGYAGRAVIRKNGHLGDMA